MSELIRTPGTNTPEAVDGILYTLERRTRVLTAAALHHPELPQAWLTENLALDHVLAKTALLELFEHDEPAALIEDLSSDQ